MYKLSNIWNFYRIRDTASVSRSPHPEFKDSIASIHLHFFFFLKKERKKKKTFWPNPVCITGEGPEGIAQTRLHRLGSRYLRCVVNEPQSLLPLGPGGPNAC